MAYEEDPEGEEEESTEMPTVGDEETSEESPKIMFALPSSVQVPPGKKMDMVCTVEGYENGQGCLVALKGVPIGEEKPEEESQSTEMMKPEGKTPGDRFNSIFRKKGM